MTVPTKDPCPMCSSRGTVIDVMHRTELTCPDCGGTGEIAAGYLERRAQGDKIRDERQARGETLSEFCKRTGASPVKQSRIERGIE